LKNLELRSWNPKKIMVRATNWIGDAVFSLPAVEALRNRFPEAEIVIVAKPWVSPLYWNHPAVSRQIVYDAEGEHRGARGFWRLVRALRAERFDAALLLQNAFHAAWMAWCAGIPVRIGYALNGRSELLTEAVEVPPRAAYGYLAYYWLQLVFRAGITDAPYPLGEMRLHLADSERKWAAQELLNLGLGGRRFLVGICPGAVFGSAKRWMPERYAGLADRLIDGLGADVLIFGSRAERPLAEAMARAMMHTPILLAGETSLREFMALLARCHLVVANDSGPLHVAGALGLPLLALYGPTDERGSAPQGERVRVVKHEVECRPCHLSECPIDSRCMKGISVDDAYTAALQAVKSWGLQRRAAGSGM
jgi:heptosyltransferase-2